MTGEPFGPGYAAAYDLLYADKAYDAECDRIELLFRRYTMNMPVFVLDLGCGTGGHAIPMAQRGYSVLGIDRSAEMVERARIKQRSLDQTEVNERLTFQQAEIQALDLGRRFDAVLMMFAVLGYQTTNTEVAGALDAARRHLQPGGLLIFDVWYGPAVLSQRPAERIKAIERPSGQLLRAAWPTVDPRHHLCVVRYRLWQFENDQPMREIVEEHRMRYFFPMELESFLSFSGFKLLHLSGFDDLEAEPDLDTWNALVCAQSV